MGGHEWVLLFYPDGKRSSSSEAGLGGGVGAVVVPPPGPGNFEGAPPPQCVSPALMSPHNITLHPRGWRTRTPMSSVLARNTGSRSSSQADSNIPHFVRPGAAAEAPLR